MTEKTPREAVDYLYSLDRFTVKPGLERAEHLLEHLGSPETEFEAIQVGGTNGKGSVARFVESVLRQEGYSVGLYTSPHMLDLGERIRVDGELMRRRAMRDYVQEVEPAVEELEDEGDPPTFFEVTTVMALQEFARRDVDVAVLEVGLGGRFDTTSVCTGDIAAVTNVALEHTETLGDTVEEIARDVAHVVPEDGVCVTAAEDQALDALEERARERGARTVEVAESSYRVTGRTPTSQTVEVEYQGDDVTVESPLVGDHQARNTAVAAGVLDEFDVSPEALSEGLHRADWPGRFEVFEDTVDVVLDAAHNPSGCRALADTYRDVYGDDATLVFGAMADKDVESMVAYLSDVAESVYVASPSKDRAAPVGRLKQAFEREGTPVESRDTVLEAVEEAIEAGDTVLVTGSLYTVGEARRRWTTNSVSADYRSPGEAEEACGDHRGFSGDDSVTRTRRLWNLTRQEVEALERAANQRASTSTADDGDYIDAVVSASFAGHHRLAEEVELPGSPEVDVAGRTEVMAVVNVTPDSFYDGGRYSSTEEAVDRALEAVEEGADVVDVGGESTRPGADPVPVDEEIDRVLPVVEEVVSRDVDAEVSVDTRNPETAQRVLDAGADWINDVTGLEDPDMHDVVADSGCRVVVMDSVDVPVEPGGGAEYDDYVADVVSRLDRKIVLARRAGVSEEDIVVDPGIGFGKGSEGDWTLLRRTDELASLGYPLLVGCSRKSFLTDAVDVPEEERLEPTLAANVVAARKGARYLRVHDVRETVKALRTVEYLEGS